MAIASCARARSISWPGAARAWLKIALSRRRLLHDRLSAYVRARTLLRRLVRFGASVREAGRGRPAAMPVMLEPGRAQAAVGAARAYLWWRGRAGTAAPGGAGLARGAPRAAQVHPLQHRGCRARVCG